MSYFSLTLAILLIGANPVEDEETQVWPSFRGPQAHGIADGPEIPVEWDKDSYLWKVPISGLSHSSPIVWGDRLFVTSAAQDVESMLKIGLYGAGESVEDEGSHRYELHCLDAETGDVIWTRLAIETVPEIKRHPKSSHANPTPVTDGSYVVASFGSEGVFCYDVEGELQWEHDFGVLNSSAPGYPDLQWGFASSPVIHEELLIIQCDVHDGSFLTALELSTGEEVWRTERKEDPTWGTPTVDVEGGRRQVIVNGYKHIGGYDLDSGEEIWSLVGGGDVPVPTPVVIDDLIYITNAHGRLAPIYAIQADAVGRVEGSSHDEFMAWYKSRRGNYMQTPLIYRGLYYGCADNGVLACYDAKTGEEHYRERLGTGSSGFTGSAVAANGRIYLSSEEGSIHVVEAGPEFKVIAVNDMGESCMATPAIAEGTLFIRTRHHLVAIRN